MQKKFSRSFDEIERIVDETEKFFDRHGIDPGLRTAVDLCVEELFVNMVTYNKESTRDILLEMTPIVDGLEVSLTDFDVERFDLDGVLGNQREEADSGADRSCG